MNQFLIALHGHNDAPGHRQWQEVNLHVRPQEKTTCILCPNVRIAAGYYELIRPTDYRNRKLTEYGQH